MEKIFITGTDTEVGKTYVTSLLCKEFRRQGKIIGAFKPVESGIEYTDTPDYKIIANAAGDKEKPLYLLKEPLAPYIAAEKENIFIDMKKIQEFVQEDIKNNFYDIYVVEGAGGLFVPINRESMIIDLIKFLGFDVILVARSNLGTVNHTLLSIEALKNRAIKIKGVVINEIITTNKQQINENIRLIEQFGKVNILGVVYNNSDFIEMRKWI